MNDPEYGDDPQQSLNASTMLMDRAMELLADGRDVEHIWNNLGFHVATVRMREINPEFPIGTTAQSYIALVLAAKEHMEANKVLQEVANGEEN